MKIIKKVTLFWKFSISIIFIVLVFGAINAFLIYENLQSSLQQETEKRGMFIVKSIADDAAALILYEDVIGMQNIINSRKNLDSAISYIFITDENNNLLVHSLVESFPIGLIEANYLGNDFTAHSQFVRIPKLSEGILLDIAYPIIQGKVGVVRIGLNENYIQNDVQKTVNIFWIMVLVFLTIGIIGALLFSNFITKPIKQIQYTAENIQFDQIGKADLPKIKIRDKFLGMFKLFFRAEDEIDILAEKFNYMLERLETAYLTVQQTQQHLVQSEKLATVGTLTAGLAHEINNPIAGIINCLRRIKGEPENIEQNKKYLNLMENAVNKIEMVVSNLLSFSRKSKGEFTAVNLNEILQSSLILISHRLEKQHIAIKKTIPQNLPFIFGDKNELEQLFINLLINSIDAIEENCSQKEKCKRNIFFSMSQINKMIEITIKDTGTGIPKNNILKVFDPFFTTKEVGNGTGLGLSIVYNIVENHDGKIEIKSEEGKGTTIILTFPTANIG